MLDLSFQIHCNIKCSKSKTLTIYLDALEILLKLLFFFFFHKQTQQRIKTCTSVFFFSLNSIRCRWSCATSVPTGTTPIESLSRGSCSWSRSWTSWPAASSRPQSCYLRSYVTETQTSGKQHLQLLVMMPL